MFCVQYVNDLSMPLFSAASALSFCPYSYFSTIYLLITFHLPGNPRLLSYPCRTLPVLFLAFHSFILSLFHSFTLSLFHSFTLSPCHPVHLSLRIFCETLETLETLFYNPLIFQTFIVSHYCHTISLSQLSHFIFTVSL